MAKSRTGEELTEFDTAPPPWPGKKCNNPKCERPGWIGYDSEDRPIPCPICKKDIQKRMITNDFSERIPSFAAQCAIDRQD